MKRLASLIFPKNTDKSKLEISRICPKGTPTLMEEEEEDLLGYFRIYFTLAYYTLVSPYRFSVNPLTKEYAVLEIGPRGTVLRFFSLLLVLLARTGVLCTLLWIRRADNIIDYMDLFSLSITTVYALIPHWIIYGRKRSFMAIFQFMTQHRHLSFWLSRKPAGGRRFMKSSNVGLTAVVICLMSFGYHGFWVFHYLTVCIAEVITSEAVFWPFGEFEIESFFGIDKSSSLILPLGVAHSLQLLYSAVLLTMADALIVISSVTLIHLLNNFLQSLDTASPQQILEDYKVIVTTLTLVNDTLGPLFLVFITGTIPLFATFMLEAFTSRNFGATVYSYAFLVTTAVYLHLAASVNRKIEQLKPWLYRNRNNKAIDGADLAVLLHDLAPGTTGLTAMGFFCISHSFCASIGGAIVSFCIILIQFNSSQATPA